MDCGEEISSGFAVACRDSAEFFEVTEEVLNEVTRLAQRKIPWGWIAPRSEARLRLLKPLNLETTMLLDHPSDGLTAIRTHIGAIFYHWN